MQLCAVNHDPAASISDVHAVSSKMVLSPLYRGDFFLAFSRFRRGQHGGETGRLTVKLGPDSWASGMCRIPKRPRSFQKAEGLCRWLNSPAQPKRRALVLVRQLPSLVLKDVKIAV